METIIQKINVYKFDELSQVIQNDVISNWNNDSDNYDLIGAESEDSLKTFCSKLNINLDNYEYGPYRNGFINWSYDGLYNIEIDDLRGLRLRTWLINNFLPEVKKGNYYSIYRNNKHWYRHSKINFQYEELTGVYTDYSLIKPILKFINDYDKSYKDYSLKDLLDECFDCFLSDYQDSIETQNSKEYIKEEIDINDYKFLKNGKIYN